MADEVMSDNCTEIIALDLGIHPTQIKTFTVKTGVTTMKPGMIVTTFGETGESIDIFADGDEYAIGIVLRRLTRKISADGAVEDTIDTAFAAGDRVEVLLFGSPAVVRMWLTGLDTAAARGTLRQGCPVYLLDLTAAAVASSNPTVGSAFALVLGSLDLNAAIHPLIQIGWLMEDATIADSTAAVAGVIAKVKLL